MKPHLNKTALFAAVFFALAPQASAQTLNTVQALHFGTLVFRDPNSVSEVTINPATGGYSNNSNTYVIIPPQRGEYQLVGGPTNSSFTISITPATSGLSGPDAKLITMDTMTVSPASHTTDGSGEATFYVGGRLASDGAGSMYNDGTYTVNYIIQYTF